MNHLVRFPLIKSLNRLLFSISVAPYELDRRPSRNWNSSKSSLVSFERQNHRFRQISLFMGYSKWRISSQKETSISRHRLNQVPTGADSRPQRVNPCTSLIFSDIKYRLTNEKQINVRFIITSFIWPEIIIRKSFRYFQSGTFYVIFIHRCFCLWLSRNNCRPMIISNLSQRSKDYSVPSIIE